MNLSAFGQSIKQKHPEYNDMSDLEVGQKVLAKYPQYKDMVDETSPSLGEHIGGPIGGVTDFLTSGIQDYGKKLVGNMQNISQDIQQMPQIMQQAQSDPQFAAQKMQEISKLATNTAKDSSLWSPTGANAAMDITALSGVPEMAKGAVTNIPKYLTRGGTSKAISEAAGEATKAGKSIASGDLATKITQGVTDKFGAIKDITDPLEQLLKEKITPSIESAGKTAGTGTRTVPKMTPDELLKWRQQIGARLGSKNFLQRMMGTNIDDKVANEARRIISSELKDLAPKIVTPDKIYSLQAKLYPKLKVLGAITVADRLGLTGPIKDLFKHLVQ